MLATLRSPACRRKPTTSKRSPPRLAGVEETAVTPVLPYLSTWNLREQEPQGLLKAVRRLKQAAKLSATANISLHVCPRCSRSCSCFGREPVVDCLQVAHVRSLGSSDAGKCV